MCATPQLKDQCHIHCHLFFSVVNNTVVLIHLRQKLTLRLMASFLLPSNDLKHYHFREWLIQICIISGAFGISKLLQSHKTNFWPLTTVLFADKDWEEALVAIIHIYLVEEKYGISIQGIVLPQCNNFQE